MVSKEPIHLPLRWEFAPVKTPHDGAVRWQWRAFSQTGKLEMESTQAFEMLTECMEDARLHGYEPR
jgi:hypothetical protein